MALNFELAIYLVVFGLVDRVFIGPTTVCANRLDHESPLKTPSEDRRDKKRDTAPYPEAEPYLSLRLDDVKISEYREDVIDKYYLEKRLIKRESDGNSVQSEAPFRYSQSVPERIYGDGVGASSARNEKDNGQPKPFLSVPFETVVTITRDNVPQAAQTSFEETRNPTDESSPCLEKEYSRREIPGKPESKKPKDTSLKRRITGIANFLQILRKVVRKRENMKLEEKDIESKTSEHEKPDEEYTEFAETPITVFEDDSTQQKKNETSQRQELDDGEESQGSLGSITDLLPVVLPILQDLSDPNSSTDLAALVEATVPILTSLFGGGDDPNGPNILNTIISAVTTVLEGTGGQGINIAELAGPFIDISGPFIAPVIGPVFNYAIKILTDPDALIGIYKSVLGAVTQPRPDGTFPLLDAITDFTATLIKDLRVGLPGGLDVGAIVEAVTTGTITAISEVSLAPLSGAKPYGPYGAYAPYGPYGTGPVQAASVNSLQSIPGDVVPPPDTDSTEQTDLLNPVAAPANTVHHRTIRFHTTRRPQNQAPKRTTPRSPFSVPNFLQHYATDPVQALPANGHGTYGAYGNNGVPATSVNPFSLIISSIQNVTGDGIQLVASLINAIFGIMGASSAESGPPAQYGPPAAYGPPPPYGQYKPPPGNIKRPA